jgi:hypothetical protein
MKRTTPTGQKPIETDEEPNGKNKNELRAEWEEMRMTVCANGVVNVANLSYGEGNVGDHIHSVMLDGATAVRCSCPHHVHRGARCKHMIAVENRPLVVSGASVAADTYTPASTSRRVAADGGERR